MSKIYDFQDLCKKQNPNAMGKDLEMYAKMIIWMTAFVQSQWKKSFVGTLNKNDLHFIQTCHIQFSCFLLNNSRSNSSNYFQGTEKQRWQLNGSSKKERMPMISFDGYLDFMIVKDGKSNNN